MEKHKGIYCVTGLIDNNISTYIAISNQSDCGRMMCSCHINLYEMIIMSGALQLATKQLNMIALFTTS